MQQRLPVARSRFSCCLGDRCWKIEQGVTERQVVGEIGPQAVRGDDPVGALLRPQCLHPLLPCPLLLRLQQGRPADSCFATDEDESPLTGNRRFQRLGQHALFFISPHEQGIEGCVYQDHRPAAQIVSQRVVSASNQTVWDNIRIAACTTPTAYGDTNRVAHATERHHLDP